LVVASTPSIAVGWLLQVVGSFSQRYPEVELQLVNIAPLQREIPSEVDVALCYGEPEVRQRSAEPLFKERYVPVCSPRLLKSLAPIARPADVLQYPLVHDRHLLWQRWLPMHAGVAAGSHNLHFQEAFQALAAVREGFGIGLADRLEISSDLHNGNLLNVLDQAISAEHSYYLVAQPASRQNVRTQLFVESVRAELGAYSE
jgi:LysR family glycine cleavage system transcriptional activator